eukprot:m.217115 g.217115  ORF g.217115 m.217115 type:complete len:432 (-) comp16986_c3_seq9:1183-2478(-)
MAERRRRCVSEGTDSVYPHLFLNQVDVNKIESSPFDSLHQLQQTLPGEMATSSLSSLTANPTTPATALPATSAHPITSATPPIASTTPSTTHFTSPLSSDPGTPSAKISTTPNALKAMQLAATRTRSTSTTTPTSPLSTLAVASPPQSTNMDTSPQSNAGHHPSAHNTMEEDNNTKQTGQLPQRSGIVEPPQEQQPQQQQQVPHSPLSEKRSAYTLLMQLFDSWNQAKAKGTSSSVPGSPSPDTGPSNVPALLLEPASPISSTPPSPGTRTRSHSVSLSNPATRQAQLFSKDELYSMLSPMSTAQQDLRQQQQQETPQQHAHAHPHPHPHPRSYSVSQASSQAVFGEEQLVYTTKTTTTTSSSSSTSPQHTAATHPRSLSERGSPGLDSNADAAPASSQPQTPNSTQSRPWRRSVERDARVVLSASGFDLG